MPLELNHDQIATKTVSRFIQAGRLTTIAQTQGNISGCVLSSYGSRHIRNRNETPPMTAELPDHALALRSLVTSQGTLELSLHRDPVRRPAANEVLVRVEASPINPSDLGLLIAGADMTTAKVSGTPERPIVTASLGAGALLGGAFGTSRQITSCG
jgi:hypothetical protein